MNLTLCTADLQLRHPLQRVGQPSRGAGDQSGRLSALAPTSTPYRICPELPATTQAIVRTELMSYFRRFAWSTSHESTCKVMLNRVRGMPSNRHSTRTAASAAAGE